MDTLVIFANRYDAAIVEVLERRNKAVRVRNVESGRTCWLPLAGLAERKPGVPTYENERVLKGWFSRRISRSQEKVLNLLD